MRTKPIVFVFVLVSTVIESTATLCVKFRDNRKTFTVGYCQMQRSACEVGTPVTLPCSARLPTWTCRALRVLQKGTSSHNGSRNEAQRGNFLIGTKNVSLK